MSNQCAAGKMKHVTLMIPEKPEIILTLNRGKSWHVITASYNVGTSTINEIKKQKIHL
jgi:hypothetical protein